MAHPNTPALEHPGRRRHGPLTWSALTLEGLRCKRGCVHQGHSIHEEPVKRRAAVNGRVAQSRLPAPCGAGHDRAPADTQSGDGGSPDSGPALPRRREVLKAAFGIALCVPLLEVCPAHADDPKDSRPQVGDQLVAASGEKEGKVIKPGDLSVGGPQQLAFPMDPGARVVRDGSYFNQVALVRLDPAQLSEETRALAADGVVAYSAVCTHQGCAVSMWKADAQNLFCSCHASQFDPRD